MAKKNNGSEITDLSDLITQAEAAKLRGVSRAAIQGLIQRGRLRIVEVAGRPLVLKSEVLKFEKEKPGPKGPRKKRKEQ
jgi:excisionase family DNA binding protein